MARANDKTVQSSLHKRTTTDHSYLLNLDKEQYFTCEDFILIWLDTQLDVLGEDFMYLIENFQPLVHLILPTGDPNRCLDFITDKKNEKIFLIISGSLGQEFVPIIKDWDQIDSIYIYCGDTNKHKAWSKNEKKIKGVFQDVEDMFDVFRRDVRQCADDLMQFQILSSNFQLNQTDHRTDQLFIYTQLLKNILIEMDYKSNTKQEFVDLCSCQYSNNPFQLNIIKEFKTDYEQSSSIWWHTRECFLNSMLSKALRIHDMDIILQMGFFIRDIHREIKEQYKKSNKQKRLTVYRGQGITGTDLNHILENPNGFLSFNNFLSTTLDKTESTMYARFARDNHQLIGALFQIEVDQSNALFTPLDKISYNFECENQVLFSIQAIFRIEDIHDLQDGLFQIKLKLIPNETELLRHFRKLFNGKKDAHECLNIVTEKIRMLN